MKGSITVNLRSGGSITFAWDVPYEADRKTWVLAEETITKMLDYAINRSFEAEEVKA